MDKRFRACTVPYVERLALQTKLTLARKNSKVVLVSFGTIVMDEYWSLCRTDVKGTLSLLADALVRSSLLSSPPSAWKVPLCVLVDSVQLANRAH